MRICPSCQVKLTDKEHDAGKCPSCGHTWPAGKATVSDIGQTVDFDRSGFVPPGQVTIDESQIGQTVDEETLRNLPPQSRQTIEDDIGQTIDLSNLPEQDEDQGQRTVDQFQLGQTLDSKELPAGGIGPKSGTVPDRSIDQTIDLSEGDQQRMDDLWADAVKPGMRPGMTIKGKESGGSQAEQNLKIQPRALRMSGDCKTSEADYELLETLGQGGMGVVYTARQACIDRTVAVKMIKSPAAKDATQREKFLSEAVVTGELDHPNIVPIYDLGSNEAGALFYSMKRVEGTPWDDQIADKSLHENLEILMKVADAIAFAHARGVIHRDLKPENVMLGGFGEVLVMDWGLALPTEEFSKAESVGHSAGMGGTPAYMAPEMASGRADEISFCSDIYLLGAMLFEIVTGRPPHTGESTMRCLFAAAKNEIVATDQSGELMDVALKAMASDPADRYATVADFQNAIREYLAHSESISLSVRAAQDLREAQQTDDYQDYARAVFAFQEAFALWEGNAKARQGLLEAQLAYARSAQRKGDYDLGLSLLEMEAPPHAPLRDELKSAKAERDARQQRLARAKRLMAGGAVAFMVVLSGAAVWINAERQEAVIQREEAQRQEKIAKDQKKIAEKNEKEALRQKGIAEKNLERAIEGERLAKENEQEAIRQKGIAEKNLMRAVEQERLAKKNEMEAVRQKGIAEKNFKKAIQQEKIAKKNEKLAKEAEKVAKKNEAEAVKQRKLAQANFIKATEQEKLAKKNAAEALRQKGVAEKNLTEAKRQEKLALDAKAAQEYETYLALIGVAAAKIDQNAFGTAYQTLLACEKRLRNWEWYRLMHVCTQEYRLFDAGSRVEAVAFAPDGRRFVTGGWDGRALVWDRETGDAIPLPHEASFIHAVAFSPDGRRVATGANDYKIRVWDVASRKVAQTLTGHADSVSSLEFSKDGRRLLSASYDQTARLWDVDAGREIRKFVAHTWWVWDAAFSPDETQIVTASQDGTARVWSAADGKPGPPFAGHNGPVFSAAFSPDGKSVVTGGYDKRVLLWRPDEVQPPDYKKLAYGQPVEPPKFVAFDGHTAAVRSVAFSKDGDQLISGAHDNAVNLWHVRSGQLIKSLRGHDSWVRACAFSPDGPLVLSGGYDGENQIRLWDIKGYEEVRILRGHLLRGHADSIFAVGFSKQGDRIVTASRDRTAKVFDFKTGEEKLTLAEGHAFLASRALFFNKGQRLVTAAVDNTTRIWNVSVGTQLQLLEGTGHRAALAVSHDTAAGNPGWVLTGSDNNLAKVWDAAKGTILKGLTGHTSSVTAVAVSRDNRLLFTGDNRGHGKLWQAGTWRQVTSFTLPSREKITAAAFLPDGSRLLVASLDKTVTQIDPRTGRESRSLLLRHPDAVVTLALTHDGGKALTSCRDGKVRVWDVVRGRELGALQTSGDKSLDAIDVSRDGKTAITVNTQDGLVQLWDVETFAEKFVKDEKGRNGHFLDFDLLGGTVWSAVFSPDDQHVVTVGGATARLWDMQTTAQQTRDRMSFSPNGAMAAADFSPSGKYIVTGSWDNAAKIWDAASGKAIIKLDRDGHTSFVNSAIFSSDGTKVLTASDDRTAIIWQVDFIAKTARPLTRFKGHAAAVRGAVYSPDGRYVLTASDDKTARLWDARTGQPLGKPFVGHLLGVRCAAFSPDAARMITGSEDNTARIWNVKTRGEIATIRGHTAAVTSVAYSRDGRRAITGSEDYTAKLWDASTGHEGKPVLNLNGHTQAVTSVRFSKDGRYLVTGSRDGTAMVWLTSQWTGATEVAER